MAIVRFDAIRTINEAAITSSFAVFGAVINHNWRTLKVTNNTDGDMFISFDGTTINMFVPKNGFTLYDFSTNSPPLSETDNLLIGLGTQVYIKYSTAPSTGDVWMEGMYSKGD